MPTYYNPTLPYAQVHTLILVNKRRMDYAYDISNTQAMSVELRLLANDPTVNGVIYPVDNYTSDLYGEWDGDFCNPYAANGVAEAIYDRVIQSALSSYPNIKYVVIVGDDSMIPFYRVPDTSTLANEREYLLSANLQGGNATWAALGWGFLLTDNFYGDLNPKYWHGHGLYVPDLAVGRLVETPEEIVRLVQHYLASGKNGFNPQTSLVTGYDFLTDSAEATRDLMEDQELVTTALISEDWTATNLKDAWTENPTRQDLASVSAHFEHWNAIPASGSDLFLSTEISNAATSPIDTVVWSVGCHAGYSVHDAHSANATSALDFAQAFAWEQTGGFVGNTGYGLGDTTEIAYSEQLLLYFAQELGSQEDMPVGEALVNAKQRYVGSAPSGGFSRYDEKVMIEATLYGLPMYQVTVPDPVPVDSSGAGPMGMNVIGHSAASDGESYEDLTLSFTFEPHNVTDWGTYYTVQGYEDTQASAGRPIQPLVITDVTRSGLTARGVVVVSAEFYATTLDPVIATLVTDTSKSEPDFAYDGWYPTNIAAINRLGDRDNLVIVPAQFHSGSQTERLYTGLTLSVYYADSTDYMPPSIWSVESECWEGEATFSVEASDDESGIAHVWVTYEYTTGQWRSDGLVYNLVTGLWEGTINSLLSEFSYLVQVVDGAGNVSATSNKGLYFAAEPERIYLPVVLRDVSSS